MPKHGRNSSNYNPQAWQAWNPRYRRNPISWGHERLTYNPMAPIVVEYRSVLRDAKHKFYSEPAYKRIWQNAFDQGFNLGLWPITDLTFIALQDDELVSEIDQYLRNLYPSTAARDAQQDWYVARAARRFMRQR